MESPTVPNLTWTTQCCIVGGGPAGMMLGWLLARAGVDVIVLEKHRDFLRDFRGDTIHPSTLDVIGELGVLEEFLKLPHQQVEEMRGRVDDLDVTIADFRHVSTRCRFLAFMPQWDFLEFAANQARRYPGFRLSMESEAIGLIEESGRVVGVRAATPQGTIDVRAALTVGADGRDSILRDQSGLAVRELGAPMDVLWMRISRRPADPDVPFGRIAGGQVLVLIYREEYWQCGLVIPKGGYEAIRQRGFDALRQRIADLAPFLAERLVELRGWEDIHLLTVRVNRMQTWHRPGLLFIGDAAHAMSPVGGVGINLAIQDAVATARELAGPLRAGKITEENLHAVQRRREFPTRVTQAGQVFLQNHVIGPTLRGGTGTRAPWALRLFNHLPMLRRIPAQLIGVGVRPEHVG